MVSGSGRFVGAPDSIQALKSFFFSSETFKVPGGISSDSMRCRINEASGLPATKAGPESPPWTIKRTSLRSSEPSCVSVAPWQSKQYSRRIGRIWDSNFGSSAELIPQAATTAKVATIRANKEKLCDIEYQAGRRGGLAGYRQPSPSGRQSGF